MTAVILTHIDGAAVELAVAKLLDALAVLLAIAGIGLSVYASYDASKDLQAWRESGFNGLGEMNTRMHVRDSINFEVLHGILGVLAILGAFSLYGYASRSDFRPLLAAIFYLGYVGIQALVIRNQIVNMLARRKLRESIGDEEKDPEAHHRMKVMETVTVTVEDEDKND